MTRALAQLFALGFTTLALVACGDSIEDESDDDDVTTFDCEGVTCDSAAGEFCWYQRFPNGEVHTATCFAPDTACTSCACAEEAIATYLDGSNNCDSLTTCSQQDATITYSCDNPPI